MPKQWVPGIFKKLNKVKLFIIYSKLNNLFITLRRATTSDSSRISLKFHECRSRNCRIAKFAAEFWEKIMQGFYWQSSMLPITLK